jgi:hypothetical protein
MATKKQRRRREKLQRHEYEYVVETEEGEEVVVDSPRAAPQRAKGAAKAPPKVVDRRGREVPPPSWRRVLKRGAIFAPILFILIWITGGGISTEAKILNAVLLILIFLPFSYLADTLIYRTMLKRQRKAQGGS